LKKNSTRKTFRRLERDRTVARGGPAARPRRPDLEGARKILAQRPIGGLLAEGLQEIAEGLKTDRRNFAAKFTCHKVGLNLAPTDYTAATVRETRRKLDCSQAIFAQFLGVSIGAVRNWEQGVNAPEHAARRLMDEIRHDTKYWKKRLEQLAVHKKVGTGS
jgi:putative transcriptional regulator